MSFVAFSLGGVLSFVTLLRTDRGLEVVFSREREGLGCRSAAISSVEGRTGGGAELDDDGSLDAGATWLGMDFLEAFFGSEGRDFPLALDDGRGQVT